MDSPAMTIQGDLSVFQTAQFYPGDELNFSYKGNGTINTFWLAIYIEKDETGPLYNSNDFFNFFVRGEYPQGWDFTSEWWVDSPTLPKDNPTTKRTTSTLANTTTNSTTPTPNYGCSKGKPKFPNWCQESLGAYPNDPMVAQDDLSITEPGVVSGYLLDDVSTAVLSIPTFLQFDNDRYKFSTAIRDFIGNATQKKASRVIIDLQRNEGGAVFLAFNTFKQFFYALDIRMDSRIRSHELANILGNTYTEWWDSLEQNPNGNNGRNKELYNAHAAEEWVVTNRINTATGKKFSNWAEYAGPVVDGGDGFSLNVSICRERLRYELNVDSKDITSPTLFLTLLPLIIGFHMDIVFLSTPLPRLSLGPPRISS